MPRVAITDDLRGMHSPKREEEFSQMTCRRHPAQIADKYLHKINLMAIYTCELMIGLTGRSDYNKPYE
jgi:hypothetical protein